MITLAFDTSGGYLSAAVFDGKKLKASFDSDTEARHSEALVPMLEKILKSAKVNPAKIGCVAVGLGPGSFTGLRIGVTSAKILAYSLKAGIVGVPSLEAMARSAEDDGTYAVAADARRSQVYGAVYRKKSGRWTTVSKPKLYMREAFLNSLPAGAVLMEAAKAGAQAVAEAAFERISRGKFDDPFLLEPLYISPKDCNVSKK